jgi:hypothetical protein
LKTKIEERLDPEVMDMCLLMEHQIVLAMLMAGYAIAEVQSKVTMFPDEELTESMTIMESTVIFYIGEKENGSRRLIKFVSLMECFFPLECYDYTIGFNATDIIKDTDNLTSCQISERKVYPKVRISQQQGEVLVNETILWLKEQLMNLLNSRN